MARHMTEHFIGARPGGDGVFFRVWAPLHKAVAVMVDGAAEVFALSAEDNGYFSGRLSGIAAGATYRYRLGADDAAYPDPASRFQPQGPHGPSQVVDSGRLQ